VLHRTVATVAAVVVPSVATTTLLNSLSNVELAPVVTAPLLNSLSNGATITAAPAGSTVPTIRAQSACSLVERIEQSYGGLRFKAFYCDGWPV